MLIKRPIGSNPPLDLDEVKGRLRILADDFDPDLAFIVRGAAEAFEVETGVAVMPANYEYRVDCFGGLMLPRSPVRSVSSVSYIDDAGATQSLDTADWHFDLTGGGARIGYSTSWSPPWFVGDYRPGRIRVLFSAGYDDPATPSSDSAYTRPDSVDLAIMFLVGVWMENREAAGAEQRYEVPNTFKYLASQFKVYR
jgi:uncharacterized phiE125 gp8 family phage protein